MSWQNDPVVTLPDFEEVEVVHKDGRVETVEFPVGTPIEVQKKALTKYTASERPQPASQAAPQKPAQEDASWMSQFGQGMKSGADILKRRVLGDTAVAGLKGWVGVPQAITGMADMVPVTKWVPGVGDNPLLEKAVKDSGIPLYGWSGYMQEKLGIDYDETQKILEKAYSTETQQARKNVENAEGLLNKIGAALTNPSAVLTTIGESIPVMMAGGQIGGAMKGVGLAAKGAIGEGLIQAGSAAEDARANSKSGFLSDKQVAASAVSGALTGMISLLGGKVAAKFGLDDIDVLMTGKATPQAAQNRVIKAVAGALSEGIEETPQSIQEQIFSNIANDRPWYEGWDQSAVMGALSGMAMGGAANLRGGTDNKADTDRLFALPQKIRDGKPVSRKDAAAFERMTGNKLPTGQAERTEAVKNSGLLEALEADQFQEAPQPIDAEVIQPEPVQPEAYIHPQPEQVGPEPTPPPTRTWEEALAADLDAFTQEMETQPEPVTPEVPKRKSPGRKIPEQVPFTPEAPVEPVTEQQAPEASTHRDRIASELARLEQGTPQSGSRPGSMSPAQVEQKKSLLRDTLSAMDEKHPGDYVTGAQPDNLPPAPEGYVRIAHIGPRGIEESFAQDGLVYQKHGKIGSVASPYTGQYASHRGNDTAYLFDVPESLLKQHDSVQLAPGVLPPKFFIGSVQQTPEATKPAEVAPATPSAPIEAVTPEVPKPISVPKPKVGRKGAPKKSSPDASTHTEKKVWEMGREEWLGGGTRVFSGKPKTDWRTNKPIVDIDATKVGKRGAGFFSSDRSVAEQFASAMTKPGFSDVVEATVDMQRPYVVDAKGRPAKDFMIDALDEANNNSDLVKAMESSEYDGIIIRNTKDEGDIYIPKTGSQIRSDRQHRAAVEQAVSENQPVPRNVLEEYKGQPWADEALAKLETPSTGSTGVAQPSYSQTEGIPVKKNGRKDKVIRAYAEEAGLDAGKFVEAVDYVYAPLLEESERKTELWKSAREKTGLTAGDIRRLENAGFDHSSEPDKIGGVTGKKLQHFDKQAEELGLTPEELWKLLGDGKPSDIRKDDQDVLRQAEEMLSTEEWRKREQVERPEEDAEVEVLPVPEMTPEQYSRLKKAQDEFEKAYYEVRDASSTLYFNPMDPKLVKSMANLTAKAVKLGVVKFEIFMDGLIRKLGKENGDKIREMARRQWEALRATGEFPQMEPASVPVEPTPPPKPKPTPPPLPKVTPPPPPSSGTTGPRIAKTAQQRRAAGIPQRVEPEPEKVADWDDEAARRMASDPNYARKLAEELAENPRAVDKLETSVLGRYQRELENRRIKGEDVRHEILVNAQAIERTGTIWSHTGLARQVELGQDYTLGGLVGRHIRDTGTDPSDAQMDRYADIADQIAAEEKILAEIQQKRAEAELDAQVEEFKNTPTKKPGKGAKKDALARAKDAAVQKMKSALAKVKKAFATSATRPTSGGLDPEIVSALAEAAVAAAELARAYAAIGVNNVLEFLASVRTDLGSIDEQQEKIFREAWANENVEAPISEDSEPSEIGALAKQMFRWAIESGISERDPAVDAVHEVLSEFIPGLTRTDTINAISNYGVFRELPNDEISVKVRGYRAELQMIRQLEDMESGVAPKATGWSRDEPTDEARALRKKVNEAKKRGGYFTRDPAKALKSALDSAKTALNNRISDVKQEIASKTRILKERKQLEPDAELLALRKTLDELLIQHKEIFPPQPKIQTAKQQEEAAQRQIARLQAELKDIKAGRERTKTSQPDLRTAEVKKQLKEWRERLKAARKAAKESDLARWEEEGGAIQSKAKKQLTDAQRLERALKALDRQITLLKGDLAAGRVMPKDRPTPITDPKRTAKEQELKALKAAMEEARKGSPEYQAYLEKQSDERYKKSLAKRLTFWEKRLSDAKRGIVPAKRKKTSRRMDNAAREQQYQIELLKRHVRAELEESARSARGPLGKALGYGGDLLDLSRAIMTGYEMSAVLRQGAFYTLGFPRQAFPAIWNSARAAFSRRADYAIHDDLMKRPNHLDYVAGGLETTTDDGPLSSREEMLRSRIATWLAKQEGTGWVLPKWAAEGLLGSERAFRTFLNTMRADLFDYMKAGVESARPGTWSEDDAKIIGNASNVFSGRAKIPNAVGWSRVFFAPRWIWSRVQVMSFQPIWKGDRATRIAVGKVYVRAALGMGTYFILRHILYSLMAGDDDKEPEYEIDPRSSDFGKMKVGDTRIDSGAGTSQLVTFAARMITGQTKRASGDIVSLRGDDVPYGADDARDAFHRFLDTKLSPLPSAVLDFMAGENVVGDKATLGRVIGDRVVPMTWRDIWDAEKELNVPQGTTAAIEAFFGTGISTYGPKTEYRESSSEERQKIFEKDLDRMQWNDPPLAYKEFLSKEQLKQAEDRRQEKITDVVETAVQARPVRKNHKSDKTYQESLAKREKDLERFRELSETMTYDEALKRLTPKYTRSGNYTDDYADKLRRLKELYGQ